MSHPIPHRPRRLEICERAPSPPTPLSGNEPTPPCRHPRPPASSCLPRLTLQVDQLDQNAAVNKPGGIVGAFTPVADQVSTDSLQPYRWVGGCSLAALQVGGWVLPGRLIMQRVREGGTHQTGCRVPARSRPPVSARATRVRVPSTCPVERPPTFKFTNRRSLSGSLSPSACRSEVFGLQRFRECELIHGRWAMLACLGALVQEATTGDSWVAAQTIVYDQPQVGAAPGAPGGWWCMSNAILLERQHAAAPAACATRAARTPGCPSPTRLPLPPPPPLPPVLQYAGVDLPFSIYTLAILNSVLMGGVELFRNTELDPERRCYPGELPRGWWWCCGIDLVLLCSTAEMQLCDVGGRFQARRVCGCPPPHRLRTPSPLSAHSPRPLAPHPPALQAAPLTPSTWRLTTASAPTSCARRRSSTRAWQWCPSWVTPCRPGTLARARWARCRSSAPASKQLPDSSPSALAGPT